ncbi:hypothetical protein QNM99_26785 [Pseudomonas sp. PCH446]
MLDIQGVKESKTDANPSVYGQCGDGKTSKLQSVQDRLDFAGESAPIIQAGAYGEDGLLEILEVRAAGGQREILVDDCSRQQILRFWNGNHVLNMSRILTAW